MHFFVAPLAMSPRSYDFPVTWTFKSATGELPLLCIVTATPGAIQRNPARKSATQVVVTMSVLSENRGFTATTLFRRTNGITEHERLTQRKSKRPIECFVCMPWFCEICCVNVFVVAPYRTNISPSRVWSRGLVDLAFVHLRRTIFRRRRHWRTRYKAVRSIGLSMRFRISHRPVENAKTVPWESNVAKRPRARKMQIRNLLMRTRTNPIDLLCALEVWRHMQFR